MIGHLNNESDARTFSDYLYVHGIKNQVEVERDGLWTVWVHGEDELAPASDLLQRFQGNPKDPEYHRAAKQARELMEREERQEAAAAKRYFDSKQLFRQPGLFGMGLLTTCLISFSVVLWILMQLYRNTAIWDLLMISNFDENGPASRLRYGLHEIRQGQIWRIFTPIFVHAPMPMFLHILFNMLWLRDLGSMVEYRQGTIRLALLVLVISAASNLAQYYVSGPGFGGMSGVVYGLLGYIWMKARFDPTSGYSLHQATVVMMLIWLVLGFTGVLPIGIANTVHTVGLAVGVAWGFLSAARPLSRDS
jgi:GlpG protein